MEIKKEMRKYEKKLLCNNSILYLGKLNSEFLVIT